MPLSLRPSAGATPRHRRFLIARHLLYDDIYFWLALASALDVLLTWAILSLGGQLNELSNVFAAGGVRMLVVYKLFILTGVVLICEEIGRRRPTTGRRVADLALAITCGSVLLGLLQLLVVFRPF